MSGVAREAMEDVAPAPAVGEFGVASCGVLLASVVGVIFGPTGLVISSFSLFIEPIAADLDWDRGQSALPVTLLGLAVALSSPLKGWLVDRWGARALVLPLTAALALCLASLALARSGWQLYLLFALLGLLTPGNIPYARILGGWFERRRGAAYGILGLGFGVGGPLALYLGSACIDAFGWRATFLVYGLLEGLLALPLLYALFRERPGDLPQARRPPAGALPGATPGQAWRSADFWLIVGNLILGVFAVTGVMVHGVPLLQEHGLSREVATDVLAALWVGMIVSQPALGYLLDRYDTPRIALPFAVLAAIGLLLLLLGGPPALLWGAVFLIGLGAGGETGTTQYFVSRYFGLRHFSVIYGSIQPFTFAIAISLGSWLLGYFYDRAGSYAGSTLVLLGAFGAAAGLLVMLGRYRYAIDGEARSHGRD
ncbi:MFS transporter [Pseudomonas aeruginosa]|uniref:MFS transporter n=1 Tax=Pseudomonas aeruginosa TaxID=287 RepID=UPI0005BE62D2|nr:MFS transporter [Pseudomonas aeruginosa]AUA71223.1 MFS transporter [Pseudomonas aeruginosa]AUA95785.1 MFS transporter [Pseudomonas aeruginosa]ELL1273763.1 MFS transporter [Pseudomonas aeruginosa]ELQ3329945.1 MFS transporter [Pseudomonas aeruginosa]KAA5629298.1 MFS transporter [Pseudomonas aeruginosa]